MSQMDKLIARIKEVDSSLRFDELAKVLKGYGYDEKQPGRGGSHRTFRKKGKNPITIPKKNPVDVVYVKAVKVAIEGDEDNEKEKH